VAFCGREWKGGKETGLGKGRKVGRSKEDREGKGRGNLFP